MENVSDNSMTEILKNYVKAIVKVMLHIQLKQPLNRVFQLFKSVNRCIANAIFVMFVVNLSPLALRGIPIKRNVQESKNAYFVIHNFKMFLVNP